MRKYAADGVVSLSKIHLGPRSYFPRCIPADVHLVKSYCVSFVVLYSERISSASELPTTRYCSSHIFRAYTAVLGSPLTSPLFRSPPSSTLESFPSFVSLGDDDKPLVARQGNPYMEQRPTISWHEVTT